MIIVRLCGGLGNQLFQYAAGRSLAHRLQTDLFCDEEGLAGDINRAFSLEGLDIKIKMANPKDAERLRSGATVNRIGRVLKLYKEDPVTLFFENGFCFDSRFTTVSGDLYLEGYWQSERYFEAISEEICTLYLGNESDATLVDNLCVAIHIRRGDYASDLKTNAFHGLCDLDYYDMATAFINKNIGQTRSLVFTDDPAWYEKEIGNKRPWELISGQYSLSTIDELRCMARCGHQIIANSSFSWWGAWLNPNPQKLVIAPAPWFDEPSLDESTLIPEEWVRMPKNKNYI